MIQFIVFLIIFSCAVGEKGQKNEKGSLSETLRAVPEISLEVSKTIHVVDTSLDCSFSRTPSEENLTAEGKRDLLKVTSIPRADTERSVQSLFSVNSVLSLYEDREVDCHLQEKEAALEGFCVSKLRQEESPDFDKRNSVFSVNSILSLYAEMQEVDCLGQQDDCVAEIEELRQEASANEENMEETKSEGARKKEGRMISEERSQTGRVTRHTLYHLYVFPLRFPYFSFTY